MQTAEQRYEDRNFRDDREQEHSLEQQAIQIVVELRKLLALEDKQINRSR